jgi:hypothetical protein
MPTLNDSEKASLLNWLRATLSAPRLSTGSRYPLSNGRIGIYVDGSAKLITSGQWQLDSLQIFVGQEPGPTSSYAMAITERLAVLAGIISAVGLWDQLTELYSAAISRSLLEAYNEMMGGLVANRGGGVVVGLAFHNERRLVAARFEGEEGYFAPGGQPMEVSGNGWVTMD